MTTTYFVWRESRNSSQWQPHIYPCIYHIRIMYSGKLRQLQNLRASHAIIVFWRAKRGERTLADGIERTENVEDSRRLWKRVGTLALSIDVLATPTVNIPPLTNLHPLSVHPWVLEETQMYIRIYQHEAWLNGENGYTCARDAVEYIYIALVGEYT